MNEDLVSVYEVMLSWLTPSYLFIIVNLVIGTIVVTSRFTRNRKLKLDSSTQLVSSNSSFFERLMSFGFNSNKCVEPRPVTEPIQNRTESLNLGACKIEQHQDSDDSAQNRLTRAPSLLERIMSVRFRRADSVKHEEEGKILVSGSESEIVDGKGEEEESVDAKADDFIRRFKQQLRLERLDSILRYRDIFQRN